MNIFIKNSFFVKLCLNIIMEYWSLFLLKKVIYLKERGFIYVIFYEVVLFIILFMFFS